MAVDTFTRHIRPSVKFRRDFAIMHQDLSLRRLDLRHRAPRISQRSGPCQPTPQEAQADQCKTGEVKHHADLQPSGSNLQFNPPASVGLDQKRPLRLGATPIRKSGTAIDEPP
jgi:hypothetical protein